MSAWSAWVARSSRVALYLIELTAAMTTLAFPASAKHGTVALTFDDLPALAITNDQTYVDKVNTALLVGLVRHKFPAIGFVNGGKVDDLLHDRQMVNLRRWLDAGMLLGNHTYSHESPNTIGAAAYVADIQRGEGAVRPLMAAHGHRLRWFRHPYLETGYPKAEKQTIDRWLTSRGYRVAPVTIDADDWEFAEPYDEAVLRADRKAQRRIMRAYLRHTAIRIDWAQRSARVLFGRDIAQVMLLHCSKLNADAIDRLAGLLKHARLRPVSLEEAMRDPADRTPDTYVGKDGPDWLERWADALHASLPAVGDEDPPKWIEQAYDRVDHDRR